eukprot:TRINITY_DN1525_c0_g1_i1.p1 TRINITY_DN1525_c0_g1~~TRINITY_DN1525_c0_g1_i1.p1  ORF type:complete len:257 (+),score=39.88 TRINITY_DN1525_c0_g1_i1:132-902(+)
MKLSGNKILITGGASGIGLGLVRRFVQEGNTVIVCGRRADALQSVANEIPGVVTRVTDLAIESDRVALYEWIAANHGDLNVLVNNAGIQNWMHPIDNADDFYERAKAEMTTNMEAPLHLSLLFLKLQSLTTIINVTSGLSFVPFTKVPVYSATKAWFHSFTLSLRYLLKDAHTSHPNGVEVIELIPPALNTDLGGKGLHDFAPPVSDFIDSVFQQLKEGKTEIAFGTAEIVSKAGQDVIKNVFDRLNTAGPAPPSK